MSLREAQKLHQHRAHTRVTGPASEPVSADEFRAHIRNDEMSDTEALGWIAAARTMIEDRLGLSIMTQTWRLTLDVWPTSGDAWWDGVRDGALSQLNGTPTPVVLPRFPVSAVTGVKVYDDSGSSDVDVDATFFVDTASNPGRLVLKNAATWPATTRNANGIEITYTAGYGTVAANIEAPIRLAVMQVAAYLESHRGDECTPMDAMQSVGGLLAQYARVRI